MTPPRGHVLGVALSENRRLWQITVGVLATEEEADRVVGRISEVICEEEDHGEACQTPWITILTDEDSLEPDQARNLKDAILDR
jgi:hypothetical protein